MLAGQGKRKDLWSVMIVVLCTGMGAVLFFTSTVPALHERDWLRGVEAERTRLRDELTQRLTDLRTHTAALAWDPQTLLLAIDAAGLTPAELLGQAVPGMPPNLAWQPAPR